MNDYVAVTGVNAAFPKSAEGDLRSIGINELSSNIINCIDFNSDSLMLSKRYYKKIDLLSAISLYSIKQCQLQSGLEKDENAGLLIGNIYGGWGYVENQLSYLYGEHSDFDSVNAYVATAWFPACVQGEVSISYKLGGYSKTFSACNLSSAYAIEHAIDMLTNNHLAVAYCGGVETLKPSIVRDTVANKNVIDSCAYLCIESVDSANERKAGISFYLNKKMLFGEKEIQSYVDCQKELLIVANQKMSALLLDKNHKIIYTDQIIPYRGGAEFSSNIVLSYLLMKKESMTDALVVSIDKHGRTMGCILTLNGEKK